MGQHPRTRARLSQGPGAEAGGEQFQFCVEQRVLGKTEWKLLLNLASSHTHTPRHMQTHAHACTQEAIHCLREKPEVSTWGLGGAGPSSSCPGHRRPLLPPGRRACIFTTETTGTDQLNRSVEGNCA